MNKCPKCEAVITSVAIQDLDGTVGGRSHWRCIAYTCPRCSTVLSVSIDPIVLKTDTVDAVVKALKGKP